SSRICSAHLDTTRSAHLEWPERRVTVRCPGVFVIRDRVFLTSACADASAPGLVIQHGLLSEDPASARYAAAGLLGRPGPARLPPGRSPLACRGRARSWPPGSCHGSRRPRTWRRTGTGCTTARW